MRVYKTFKLGRFQLEIVETGPIEKLLGRIFMLGMLLYMLSSISGCSTIGELEIMNDVGLGGVSEVMRAAESSRVVLGGTPSRTSTAPVVNRTQGEIESVLEKQDRLELRNLPHTIAQIKYIITNTRSVGEDLGK